MIQDTYCEKIQKKDQIANLEDERDTTDSKIHIIQF